MPKIKTLHEDGNERRLFEGASLEEGVFFCRGGGETVREFQFVFNSISSRTFPSFRLFVMY
jgi:hypothetical protein